MTHALNQIADRLEALIEAVDREHPLDPHEVKICAVQLRAQAEMLAKGLAE